MNTDMMESATHFARRIYAEAASLHRNNRLTISDAQRIRQEAKAWMNDPVNVKFRYHNDWRWENVSEAEFLAKLFLNANVSPN